VCLLRRALSSPPLGRTLPPTRGTCSNRAGRPPPRRLQPSSWRLPWPPLSAIGLPASASGTLLHAGTHAGPSSTSFYGVPPSSACLASPQGTPTSTAAPVLGPVPVRVLLHDDQLVWGTFVAFDRTVSPVLRDCVELNPDADRHVHGPLVFPRAMIASLAIEILLSPSPTRDFVGAPLPALSVHPVASPPSASTTDWVVDSGASFHTTPTTSSLSHSHPPHPSHPPSIVVGNGSTLPVTSVGASVLPGPFYLNDVLVAPGLTHLLSSVRRFTSDNHCSMEFYPWGLTIRHLPTRVVIARCESSASSSLFTCHPLPLPVSPPPMILLLPPPPSSGIIVLGTLDLT
jgi:small nuclear ribonucleoprotein (snRNP)-like protein